jgi:hypothetical protein
MLSEKTYVATDHSLRVLVKLLALPLVVVLKAAIVSYVLGAAGGLREVESTTSVSTSDPSSKRASRAPGDTVHRRPPVLDEIPLEKPPPPESRFSPSI